MALPTTLPGGLDQPSCGDTQCSGHGLCVMLGKDTVCECILGYRGQSCHESVNEAVSVPLTLGVLGFICGVIIAAFVFAFIRQRVHAQRRKAYASAKEANLGGACV